MEWDYPLLIQGLRCGREFEFTWNGGTYSIHCFYPEKWFFSILYPPITFEAPSVDDLLAHIYLGEKGASFEDIFPDIEDSTLF